MLLKSPIRVLALSALLSLFIISCYPQKEILHRWPNGRLKMVRYHKRNDTANEKFVSYYDNGQKEYVKYWTNDLDKSRMKAWYKDGTLQEIYWRKYKDTVCTYSPIDSDYTVKGLRMIYDKKWNEKGELKYEKYSKDGQVIERYKRGDSMITHAKKVRPDGYDSVEFKIYRTTRGVHHFSKGEKQ